MWNDQEFVVYKKKIIPTELFAKVQAISLERGSYRKNPEGILGHGWMKCGYTACGCSIVFDPLTKTIKATGASLHGLELAS